jgi:tRNA-specific 2-thiouridylase
MSCRKKIIVAMSGGVDSSAACAILKEQNYDITGVTLLLKGDIDEQSAKSIEDTVKKLGIKHQYIDCRSDFTQKVIVPSALEYACGRTPNPCCLCNPEMKFAAILSFADSLGIDLVATGHYAAIKEENNSFYLERGGDTAKDQSYFLYRLDSNILKRLYFPLADKTKSEIRQISADAGLIVFDRPDSQDVCFAVENECCGETLRRLANLEVKQGNFIYQGKKVGRHKGIHLYTIGQRKGLGVALGVPAYISKIDPVTADIELVTDESLLALNSFEVKNTVWNYPEVPESLTDITVKIRYRTSAKNCTIERKNDTWLVSSNEGCFRAVTPGQSAVFYLGNRLLGGGIIC